MTNGTLESGVKRRGFASMSLEQRHRIASMGGKSAHAKGTAHQYTSEEASAAGRKGHIARASGMVRPKKEPSPVYVPVLAPLIQQLDALEIGGELSCDPANRQPLVAYLYGPRLGKKFKTKTKAGVLHVRRVA